MFKSNVVAYLNFSIPLNISGIFGMGNGLRLRHALSMRKSVMILTVPFFFGMTKVGDAHSDVCTFVKSPMFCNLSISLFVTSTYAFGMEYGFLK